MTDHDHDNEPYIDSDGVQHYSPRTKALILIGVFLFGAAFWFSAYYAARCGLQPAAPVLAPKSSTLPGIPKLANPSVPNTWEWLEVPQHTEPGIEAPQPTEPGIELPTVTPTKRIMI